MNRNEPISASYSSEPLIGALVKARLGRRTALKALFASGLFVGGFGPLARFVSAAPSHLSSLTFAEIPNVIGDNHAVAPGYTAHVLIRWGDRVLADAPPFDPQRQSRFAQERQFGYNNDFVGYFPLPPGSSNSEHGLLCANHEYTNARLMFPGAPQGQGVSRDQADIELATHGHSVIEIRKNKGKWSVVQGSSYNRRITAHQTRMRVSGPAAEHPRLRTAEDPTGTHVLGTFSNCTGGRTPWRTVLVAEENFSNYFGGDPQKTREARNHKRYGVAAQGNSSWSRYYDRFDVEKTPNEPNRFGWIVEFDPYAPDSIPIKRTALGRFKHEGATTTLNKDGRVVVYTGDDEPFNYVYRFVTRDRFNPKNRDGNRDLLDSGILFVAKFHENGVLTWLPLVWGSGPLTPENGFESEADVLIETRRAADLIGATPMDRPEEVEPNPVNGRVYAVFTNNPQRKLGQVDGANPRGHNAHGHILELIPPGAVQHPAENAGSTFENPSTRWPDFNPALPPRPAVVAIMKNDGGEIGG